MSSFMFAHAVDMYMSRVTSTDQDISHPIVQLKDEQDKGEGKCD